MSLTNSEIKICRATRTILKYSLIWPAKGQELNPDKWYYIKVLIFILSTSIWCFCVVMHLIATLTCDLDLHISEDVAFLVVFVGIYYVTFVYVRNQKKVALLLRDLSDFEAFGVPPGFEKREALMGFLSKFITVYSIFGGGMYNIIRVLEKGECEKMEHEQDKVFNQICGLISPFWVPFDVNQDPFIYYTIVVYVVICSQTLIRLSCIIAFNAAEIAQHIILRIDHLKMMITECFDDVSSKDFQKKLNTCFSYHSEILRFSARLDDCFSMGMFAHITMTGAIFACIEKQFVDGEHPICAGIHFIGWILTLFVACVGGQQLIDSSRSIPEVIWFSRWYNADTTVQNDLRFMLMRSQQDLEMTAGPFGVMSYTVFLSVLKMSYSILCVLTS